MVNFHLNYVGFEIIPFIILYTFYISSLRKKCFWIYSISSKSMYIIDSNKYANKTDTYATNFITYWFESILQMLLAEMLWIQ